MKSEKHLRHFNIRSPFLVFVGLIIGIILCYNLIILDKDNFLLPINILLLISVIIFLAILIFLKIKININIDDYRYKKYSTYIICIITVMVSIFIGILSVETQISKIEKVMIFDGSGQITGEVESVIEYDYGTSIALKNIAIENDDDSINLTSKGKLYTTIRLDNSLQIGSVITFVGDVVSNSIFDTVDLNKIVNNYGYNITLKDDSVIKILNQTVSVRNKIHNYVLTLLNDNITSNNVNLTYSMLFGDKSILNNEVYNTFNIVGVTHLLCVSGLHIGVLSGLIFLMISKFLKMFKIKYSVYSLICFLTVALLLFGYAYLCCFTVSVLRAVIMSLVLLLSKLIGEKYDSLISLSVAGVIILLLSPLSLFDVGFQLSFACIFAIITLTPELCKLLDKIKISRKISTPLMASISVNILTLPIIINTFGEATLLSVFSNLIIIPLFSIVFTILFYCLLISLIPFMSWILFIPNLALQVLSSVVWWFSLIPFGVIKTFRIGYLVFGFVVLISYLVKYLLNAKIIKISLVALLSILSVVITINNLVPLKYNGDYVLLQYKNSTTSKIFIDDDSKLLVGVPNLNTEYFCLDRKIKKIDAMLLYDFNINEYNYILNFCNTYSTETIYLPKSYIEFVDILDFGNIKVEYYNNILKHKNSNIEMVYNNTKELIMIKIDNGLNTIAYLPKNISSADLSYISSEIDAEYFLVICDKEYYNLNDYNIKYNKLVCGASDINTDSIELYKLKEFIVRV